MNYRKKLPPLLTLALLAGFLLLNQQCHWFALPAAGA